MASKKGPISGTRIPVRLPWKGATDGESQYVSMKNVIAEKLGFDQATDAELNYVAKVKTKGGVKTVVRRRRPGYRTRAIRVEFGKNERGNKIYRDIGNKQVNSFQFPITSSVPIEQVIKFFENNAAGKKLKAKRIVEANTGQGYPIRS